MSDLVTVQAQHEAAARAEFVRAQTRLSPVPFVPELSLHLADEAIELWERTESERGEIGLPPPFWAFAWAAASESPDMSWIILNW